MTSVGLCSHHVWGSLPALCGVPALLLRRQDVPQRVWLSGFAASSLMCTVVVTVWFDMRWYESVIAILFGIPLAVICIQCTGETDTTPTGAVGKVRSSRRDFPSAPRPHPTPSLVQWLLRCWL